MFSLYRDAVPKLDGKVSVQDHKDIAIEYASWDDHFKATGGNTLLTVQFCGSTVVAACEHNMSLSKIANIEDLPMPLTLTQELTGDGLKSVKMAVVESPDEKYNVESNFDFFRDLDFFKGDGKEQAGRSYGGPGVGGGLLGTFAIVFKAIKCVTVHVFILRLTAFELF